MVTPVLRVPGVHHSERRERTTLTLPTGVPVFIGLVTATAPAPEGSVLGAQHYGPIALRRKADFLGGAVAGLGHAIAGFFDNGGRYCYVVGVRADVVDVATAARLNDALMLTSSLQDVDLVAIPDAVALRTAGGAVDVTRVRDVQAAMIKHCHESGNRIALLDSLQGKSAPELISDQLRPLRFGGLRPVNAALYHPWVRTVGTDDEFVPPCGHVAGVIARTDAEAGVFKAPANAEIYGVTDLDDAGLDAEALAVLNEAGINCLRAFPARGIRVYGARTLSADSSWRYLNVRRLVLTVVRWIDLNLRWAAFEPNVPALWARIQRGLTTYLTGLWRAGALQGEAASEAFYVRCDAELNPASAREVGAVITEVGLAPALPAEFVIISVQHRAGTTELL